MVESNEGGRDAPAIKPTRQTFVRCCACACGAARSATLENRNCLRGNRLMLPPMDEPEGKSTPRAAAVLRSGPSPASRGADSGIIRCHQGRKHEHFVVAQSRARACRPVL